MRSHSCPSLVAATLGMMAATGYGTDFALSHTATLDTPMLRVVVADNEPYGPKHQPGYNGVAELRLERDDSPSLFVPLYAGLNLEHIFSGNAASFGWHIFEPRRVPMQLVRHTPNRVELRQDKTEHWPLRSRMIYEVKDNAIDFTYCGTPLSDLWSKHGYIGVFFASYIQAPADLSIQFIGRSRPGRGDPKARWIRHLPKEHGAAASHRPAGSRWDPPLDPGFNLGLVQGLSEFEYLYPFYFGRSGKNVFILMFEKPGPEGELRFAQSPNGGGPGNPAWDFVYFRRNYVVNQEFCFRVRAVYQEFISTEAVARLYEQWSSEKVVPPAAASSTENVEENAP